MSVEARALIERCIAVVEEAIEAESALQLEGLDTEDDSDAMSVAAIKAWRSQAGMRASAVAYRAAAVTALRALAAEVDARDATQAPAEPASGTVDARPVKVPWSALRIAAPETAPEAPALPSKRAAGDALVTVGLVPEGLEGVRAVVMLHPLPWSVEGRALVDARGRAVVGADSRGAVWELVASLAAAVVTAAHGEAVAREGEG